MAFTDHRTYSMRRHRSCLHDDQGDLVPGAGRSGAGSSMRVAKCCVSTGPRTDVTSTMMRTPLSIRLSSNGWPAALKVLYATRVAASVAATCGSVSDHIVLRAAA